MTNLRTLLLSAALAATACSVTVPNQFKCPTPGKTDGCDTGQICGPDLFCTTLVTCTATEKRCNGVCVDITHNRENCGDCSDPTAANTHICAPSEQCLTDSQNVTKCQPFCATGQTACAQTTGGFICENLSNDVNNCGTCGNACPQGKVCKPPSAGQPGQCTTDCFPLTACSGSCKDLTTDDASCGACGHACGTGEHCVGGACSIVCTPGLTECPAGSGTCVDTAKDRDNCGGCGAANACLAGQICVGSQCKVNCQANQVNCNGKCIDPQSDRSFCGAKKDAADASLDCVGANAGTACAAGDVCLPHGAGGAGVCELQCPTTPVLQTACNGACVDLLTDRGNCGSCNSGVNPSACGAGEICTGGHCQVSCPSNLTACSSQCIDTQNDPANCGTCGHSCPQGQVCTAGGCAIKCPGTQVNCGGACVDTSSDPANCGGCAGAGGVACSVTFGPGYACVGSGCTLQCPSGSINCGGKCVDPLHDDANCGGCAGAGGQVCQPGKSCQQVAAAGQCLPTCDGSAGLAVCAGNPGTCTDIRHDPANCGSCGTICGPYDNGAAYCAPSSGCAAACTSSFNDCDADPSNGCESNSLADAANCGGCPGGAVCGAGRPYCVNGGCAAAPSGVLQNLATAAVTADGWTQCFGETYASGGSTISSIQAACTGAQVMIACAAPGATTLQVAAAGPRATVFGGGVAGGVLFYADAGAIGFAPAAATVTRAPCDTAGGVADGFVAGSGSQRLCWPATSGVLNAGARCGDREGSGATTNFQRLVFTK